MINIKTLLSANMYFNFKNTFHSEYSQFSLNWSCDNTIELFFLEAICKSDINLLVCCVLSKSTVYNTQTKQLLEHQSNFLYILI